MPKTIREFRSQTDIWSAVDEWAHSQRLLFTEEAIPRASAEPPAISPKVRTYKAGSPASLTSAYIRIIQLGDAVRIEGWKTPGDRAIESFSVFGATNPYMLGAKPAFNKLLQKLGQAPLGSESQRAAETTARSAFSEYTAAEDQERQKKRIYREMALPWVLAGCFITAGGAILWMGGYEFFCLPLWLLGVAIMLVGNVRAKQELDRIGKTAVNMSKDADLPSPIEQKPDL